MGRPSHPAIPGRTVSLWPRRSWGFHERMRTTRPHTTLFRAKAERQTVPYTLPYLTGPDRVDGEPERDLYFSLLDGAVSGLSSDVVLGAFPFLY